MLVDCHAHLEELEDPEAAVERAGRSGVRSIVAVGSDRESNRRVLSLSGRHGEVTVHAALGIHPWRLEGKRSVLSHVNVKSRCRVGKYGVDVKSFEAFLESLHLKARVGSLIVMDEIGKMECLSDAFVSLVRELLDGAGVVVATVALKGPDVISEV